MTKGSGGTSEGFPAEGQYTTGPSCWAGVKTTRPKEVFAGNTERVIGATVFTIRYRKDVNDDMVISYKGEIYEIESIVDVNEGHYKMEILAKKVK